MDDHTTTLDSAPKAQTTPPLPPDVRDLIFSHLVPPALPLPHQLLARTFLERLTFLPPDPDELDAHLTPFPPSTTYGAMAKDARNPQALYVALEQLSGSLKISDPEYAADGDMTTIARTRLAPEFGADGAVDTYFEHEDGEQGRGWVYRGATLGGSNLGDQWDWKNRVEDVRYNTTGFGYGGSGDDQAPEDYWAGFTPPSGRAELPGDDNEDDYWAQYGAGAQSSGHTQPPSRGDRGLEGEGEQEDANTDPEPLTPPTATIAAPDPAATLSLLLHGLNADAAKADTQHAEVAAAETPSRPSALEQKLRAKVRAQLMGAWTAFSADQDAEAAAYEWLKVGREIADRPSWGGNASSSSSQDAFGDVRPAVLRARIEAAKDVHDILDNEPAGSFFHLCEEAIRLRNPLTEGAEEQEGRYDYE